MILRSTVGITSFLFSLFSFFLLFFATLERCLGFRSFVLASDNFCVYFEPIKLSMFVLLSQTFSGSFITFYNWKMLHFFWTYAVFSLIVFSVKVTQPLKQKHSASSFNPLLPKTSKSTNIKMLNLMISLYQKYKNENVKNTKQKSTHRNCLHPTFVPLFFASIFSSFFLVCIIWLFCRNKKMRIK